MISKPDFNPIVEKKEIYQMILGCIKDEYESIMRDVKGTCITAWWDRA